MQPEGEIDGERQSHGCVNEAKHKPDPELWHFGFFQQRDIPELLVTGHEFAFIRDFIHDREFRPIADNDIRVYADAYAAPGGLRAGFELYRAFPEDERRFAMLETTKLTMPVLALAGDKSNGTVELTMAQGLATNVVGGTAPDTGHWLPDENPEFLSRQLIDFLGKHGRDGLFKCRGVSGVADGDRRKRIHYRSQKKASLVEAYRT